MNAAKRALAVVMFTSLVGVSTAHASPVDDARAHFKRGTELYDEGNYRGALLEFQAAFELTPNYKLHYNMGQVYVEINDYAKALKELDRYLTEGGTDVAPARKDEVRKQIDRLKSRVGDLVVEAPRGAEILIDDESVGFAPLEGPKPLSIGRHRVTAMMAGKAPITRAIDVPGLQTITVNMGVEGGAVSSSEGSSSAVGISSSAGSSAPSKKLVVGLWAVTGVLAVAAISFGIVTLGDSGTLKTERAQFPADRDMLVAQAGKVGTMALVSDVFTATAVVAGAAALIVTVMNVTAGSSSPVALSVGPGSIGLSGHF